MNSRAGLVRRGLYLESLTIAWNFLEAVAAIVSGLMAGSVALMGFGLDSMIEMGAGTVLIWRLRSDSDNGRRERVERISLRMVGVSFFALAAFVTWESVFSLRSHEVPSRSRLGILVAVASLVVMPLLARAKRRVAAELNSRALHADSRQTSLCAYLSAILLGGLTLNAVFGWWWADPIAGLGMVPLILKEGADAIQGKTCACAEIGSHE